MAASSSEFTGVTVDLDSNDQDFEQQDALMQLEQLEQNGGLGDDDLEFQGMSRHVHAAGLFFS